MLFDRRKFFSRMRREFPPRLRQHQVEGAQSLLASFEADSKLDDVRVVAYLLATAWHETAQTLQPICERGSRKYFESRYDPVLGSTARRRNYAKRMGNTERGDGYEYRGRGYVQLTWKCNYQRATKELGIDFVSDPNKALIPMCAYLIFSCGLLRGWYTGAKLGEYINDHRCNYLSARRTVNGMDRAALIAGYAHKFEHCLRDALLPEEKPQTAIKVSVRKRKPKQTEVKT